MKTIKKTTYNPNQSRFTHSKHYSVHRPSPRMQAPNFGNISVNDYDHSQARTGSATSHLKPSRLRDYTTDTHAVNDQLRKKSSQRSSESSPRKKAQSREGSSSIENDRRNLNNVFGISLNKHWMF